MSILLRGKSAQDVEEEEINAASNILDNTCSLILINSNYLSNSAKKQISLSSLGHFLPQLNEGHLDPNVSNNMALDSVNSSTKYFHG